MGNTAKILFWKTLQLEICRIFYKLISLIWYNVENSYRKCDILFVKWNSTTFRHLWYPDLEGVGAYKYPLIKRRIYVMSKKHKKHRLVKADDYYNDGLFELARYGKVVS